jgi:hypothetical protein
MEPTMTKDAVQFFAKVSAVNAEIEGMKAANAVRRHHGEAPAYDEHSFANMANLIRKLINYYS